MKNKYIVKPSAKITAAEEDPAKITIEDKYKDLADRVSDKVNYLLDSIEMIFMQGDSDSAIGLLQQFQSEIDSITGDATSTISDQVESGYEE
jgi:hypothetical protein